jgi:glycosyltransferase involved in cell wall biosynthesis
MPPRHIDLPSMAVLLSGREQFSPYFGGALARWTYETYSLLRDRVSVEVFGFPTRQENLYPLPHQSSGMWRVCALSGRIPLIRRHEEEFWLRALMGRLQRFQIVHIHNRPQWAGMLRRLGYRGAIIVHLQNDHLGHWSGVALDALASELDALVVCSDYLRRRFAFKSPVLNAKTHVIFNGANLRVFHPREEIREPKTIFFVGRLHPEKGVLQLLQAYECLLKKHPNAKLIIGGASGFGSKRETPYVRALREFAVDLERSKRAQIAFTGYLHHDEDLPSWFQKATVFVCPSLFHEPFGLVNAEAMACATPVVGTNRGGVPEVIGNAGRLVNPENIPEFSSAISELLEHGGYRRELGQAGYERCRKMFDWRVTAEAWITLIESLLPVSSCATRRLTRNRAALKSISFYAG